jgi:hypothetical protein
MTLPSGSNIMAPPAMAGASLVKGVHVANKLRSSSSSSLGQRLTASFRRRGSLRRMKLEINAETAMDTSCLFKRIEPWWQADPALNERA